MAATRNSASSLASEILAYLGSRPGAEDTLEGITRWWMALRPNNSATTLRVALQELTAGGSVYRRLSADRKSTWYRSGKRASAPPFPPRPT